MDGLCNLFGRPETAVLNKEFIATVALFAPVHQGLIELFKLFGLRSRQYWEALAYILWGPGWAKDANKWTWFFHAPRSLDEGEQNAWRAGPEVRLIESFLLRSVGENPVLELSDSDVAATARIARSGAGDAGRVGDVLEDLIRNVPRNVSELVGILDDLESTSTHPEIKRWIGDWLGKVRGWQQIVPAQLFFWRNEFNRRFLPAVVRAEVELPHALKAAEYRYVWYVRTASGVLALIEGAIIAAGHRASFLAALVAAGALVVLPETTKSITDALVGIGRKLRR